MKNTNLPLTPQMRRDIEKAAQRRKDRERWQSLAAFVCACEITGDMTVKEVVIAQRLVDDGWTGTDNELLNAVKKLAR